jgi:hypothetical protein
VKEPTEVADEASESEALGLGVIDDVTVTRAENVALTVTVERTVKVSVMPLLALTDTLESEDIEGEGEEQEERVLVSVELYERGAEKDCV